MVRLWVIFLFLISAEYAHSETEQYSLARENKDLRRTKQALPRSKSPRKKITLSRDQHPLLSSEAWKHLRFREKQAYLKSLHKIMALHHRDLQQRGVKFRWLKKTSRFESLFNYAYAGSMAGQTCFIAGWPLVTKASGASDVCMPTENMRCGQDRNGILCKPIIYGPKNCIQGASKVGFEKLEALCAANAPLEGNLSRNSVSSYIDTHLGEWETFRRQVRGVNSHLAKGSSKTTYIKAKQMTSYSKMVRRVNVLDNYFKRRITNGETQPIRTPDIEMVDKTTPASQGCTANKKYETQLVVKAAAKFSQFQSSSMATGPVRCQLSVTNKLETDNRRITFNSLGDITVALLKNSSQSRITCPPNARFSTCLPHLHTCNFRVIGSENDVPMGMVNSSSASDGVLADTTGMNWRIEPETGQLDESFSNGCEYSYEGVGTTKNNCGIKIKSCKNRLIVDWGMIKETSKMEDDQLLRAQGHQKTVRVHHQNGTVCSEKIRNSDMFIYPKGPEKPVNKSTEQLVKVLTSKCGGDWSYLRGSKQNSNTPPNSTSQ